MLSTIAEADADGIVKQVCEYYGDYVLADRDHFTLNLDNRYVSPRSPDRSLVSPSARPVPSPPSRSRWSTAPSMYVSLPALHL